MTTSNPTPKKAAAVKKTAPARRRPPRLRGVEAIRTRLADESTPIVFVGPTPYNLLGLDRWLPGLRFVSLHDPFDGAHPRLFTPTSGDTALVTGLDITNHLLGDEDVRDHLAGLETESGAKPKITVVYADVETERLCTELGYDLIIPTVTERERVAAAVDASEDEAGRPVTVAAVVTRRGTVVGPAVTSLFGDPTVTIDPYAWCGAETHARLLSTTQRARAADLVSGLGGRLAEGGFRGYFEAQLLVDDETGEVRLARVIPGIGVATALATTVAGAYADLPLYALHVLERLGVDYDLDVAELNRRAADLAVVDAQCHLVLTETGTEVEALVAAPATGRYVLDELGRALLVETALDWHGLGADEFFFLRLVSVGGHRWLGSELGVLITRGRSRTMIDSVRQGFVGVSAYSTYVS